jgi:hypothetical protein
MVGEREKAIKDCLFPLCMILIIINTRQVGSMEYKQLVSSKSQADRYEEILYNN